MNLDTNEWIQNQLRRGDSFEPLTIERIESILRPGDIYVDVGAHVGYQSLVARQKIGASGLAIAIDPQPYNCTKVLQNWALNRFENVIVYPAAVSDEERNITLFEQPEKDRARLSITAPSLSGDMPQRFVVPARRLDAIIEENNLDHIDLIKIDAEGHELNVIVSLGGQIDVVRNMIIEIYDPKLDIYIELINIIRNSGFTLLTVDGRIWTDMTLLPENNLWATRR
jgi:FkbM family methyltransferase